jgi:hypothetical protein
VDVTASRQRTWDAACQLQAEMLAQVSGLELQLVYYRGIAECDHSNWTANPRELADKMSRIACMSGCWAAQMRGHCFEKSLGGLLADF